MLHSVYVDVESLSIQRYDMTDIWYINIRVLTKRYTLLGTFDVPLFTFTPASTAMRALSSSLFDFDIMEV